MSAEGDLPGLQPGLEMLVEARGEDTVVVSVVGEVDASTAAEFEAGLERVAGGRLLVVVLTEVTFLGSRGITALLKVRNDATAAGTIPRFVVGTNRRVLRPLTMTGMSGMFALFDDLEQALRSEETPSAGLL